MSIVDHPLTWDLIVQPPNRLMTVDELDAMPDELPTGPVRYELDNGRLVMHMAPPGNLRGGAQTRIASSLFTGAELTGHGVVRTETTVVLWRNPDRVVAPDVALIAAKSLSVRTSREGYLETIPELVVEITSKNDSPAFIVRKVEHYLKAGVGIVGVIDSHARTAQVHRPDGSVETLDATQSLFLPGLVPDFALPLADIFRE